MALMDLISRHRTTEAERRDRRFRELVNAAIDKQTLTPAEIAEFDSLNTSGLDLDEVLALFGRHREYSASVAARKQREAERAAAWKKYSTHDAETARLQAEHERLMRERQETGRLLRGAADGADSALEQSILAGTLKDAVEKYDLWWAFNNPEPTPIGSGTMRPEHEQWVRNTDRCRESGLSYQDYVRNARIAENHGM